MRNEDILRLYKEGRTCKQIAEVSNITSTRVWQIIKQSGANRTTFEAQRLRYAKVEKSEKENTDKVIELYNSGLSIRSVAKETNQSRGKIARLVKKFGKPRKYIHPAGKVHPSYKGGSVNERGYRLISVNGKPKKEHRAIVEEALGRPLKRDEVIHHINLNKQDNRIENLQVVTQSEHAKIHYHIKNPFVNRWKPSRSSDSTDQ